MKTIQVLMSTYNGEKYIREQINSIYAQKNVKVKLLVRDDGSTDSTISILKEYKEIELVEGKNIGSTKSFLELIKLAGDYRYYAFADQDDVWDEDKIQIAIENLDKLNGPSLYSGNTRLVDQNLKIIKVEASDPILSLGSAIVKNYATGCTVVFNNILMRELKKYCPIEVPFHDWWVNLVCLSIGGNSIYDKTPHMMYRQHESNVVSGNASILKKWKTRLKKFRNSPYKRNLMAKQLLDNYGQTISKENLDMLNIIAKYEKWKILFAKEISTEKIVDNFLFAVCVIMNKI